MTSRTALLVGATGLVGSHCLDALLAEPNYEHVLVLTRRSLGRTDPKLEEVTVDFERLPDHAETMRADDVYCCLGTTLKVAGSKQAFRHVDHDYAVEVARMARAQGAKRLAFVSSVGADIHSSNFYLSVKGETERDVDTLGYEAVEIFRPFLLLGERAERRPGESMAGAVSRGLAGAMIGPLRKYRPIEASAVAAAMVHALVHGEPGHHVHTFDAIRSLASSESAAL
ncbi:MAG TPA: NAD-dependent epimerase/dehydratase family protein [Polyangiaceae bacterium]|nr:NAD-dependent epimerase/dehydratase family protein [Polyangiaceae bacterium]